MRRATSIKCSLVVPVPRETVWDLLSDTEHLNRAVGLPSVTFSNIRKTKGITRTAEAKLGGFLSLKWTEHLFDWTRPETYSIRRDFECGPFSQICGGIRLSANPSGTTVEITADITARSIFFLPFAYLIGWRTTGAIARYVRQSTLGKNALAEPQPVRVGTPKVNQERLFAFIDRLETISRLKKSALYKLVVLINKGMDNEVTEMQPIRCANQWGEERDSVVNLFLNSAEIGLLQLDWVLICPYCRVSKSKSETLSSLPSSFHCDLCGIDVKSDLETNTELRFSVSNQVRQTTKETYCVGGPANSKHILCQQQLAPTESKRFSMQLPDEKLRVRVLVRNTIKELLPQNGLAKSALHLRFENEEWKAEATGFFPGEAEFELVNHGTEPIVAVIEKMQRDPFALLASEAVIKAKFQNLFGPDALSPEWNLGVRHVAILFTDVQGSTALYESLGDSSAYARIRKHFGYLEEKVVSHGGTILKTMGDAVMAVFVSETNAVEAAIEIQNGFPNFNSENGITPPLRLKIGIHRGPALLVNANEKVDYFGQTVNIAARLHQIGTPGEVILSEEMMQIPEVKMLVHREGISFHKTMETLKGLGQRREATRITLEEPGNIFKKVS